jgi:hypothetical protein
VPRAVDQARVELRVMPAQDGKAAVERGMGDDVARAPDGFQRRGDVSKRDRKTVGCRKGAAAETGLPDVLDLKMDRQSIDLGRIGEHQHGQVLSVDRGDLGGAHARSRLGERLARVGPQAQRGHADQGQLAYALPEPGGHKPRDMPAKREACQPESVVRRQQLLEPGNHDLGDARRRPGLGRHRG